MTLLLCSLLLDAVSWPVLRRQVCDGGWVPNPALCLWTCISWNLPRHRGAALIRCAGDFVRNSVGLKHQGAFFLFGGYLIFYVLILNTVKKKFRPRRKRSELIKSLFQVGQVFKEFGSTFLGLQRRVSAGGWAERSQGVQPWCVWETSMSQQNLPPPM